MNLASFMENTADRIPDSTALRFEDREYTFHALNRRTNRVANTLVSMGVKRGDKCILMMESTPEFILTYYALAKIGAVAIPINFLYKIHELTHIFKDSGARVFIGMAPYLEQPAKILAQMSQVEIRIALDAEDPSAFLPLEKLDDRKGFPMATVADDDTFAIIYTSGTTGAPKGAMLTHKNLTYNAITVAEMRHTEPGDVIIGVLPLYHIFGQTSVLNSAMYLGLTLHLMRQFDPVQVLDLIENEASTIFFGVPTMLNRLIGEAEIRRIKRSSLRWCGSGGASLPAAVLGKFESIFNARIYEGYGLSECSPGCISIPYGTVAKPGSIGLPNPQVQARIVDKNDRDVARGEVGELIIKSPGVMKGYLNRPKETAETLRGGWMHTGDLARQDEHGYYYIVDRKKDMIIRGGYNVYPREIEEILYQHPKIIEAAVYGVAHSDLGEEIASDVVLREGAKVDEDDIRQFVKAQVAPYKYPRIIRFVNELPKSHTGKILKRKLREWGSGDQSS